jgi:HPt (histidine-containing phosphotransfer) domain-containing protein/CheY-like chemotaxis protein
MQKRKKIDKKLQNINFNITFVCNLLKFGMELKGLKVLVCEHDRSNLIRIYELLSGVGIQVIVSHKSIDLIEKHLNLKPDMILVNISNPDFSTTKPTLVVRKNDHSDKKTPIVVLVDEPIDTLLYLKEELKIDGFLYNNFFIEDFYWIIEKKFPQFIKDSNDSAEENSKDLVVFNKLSFIEYTGNNKDLMRKVLILFFDEVPKFFVKLKLALINKQYSEIEYFAHSIKGMAGGVFAEKVKQLAYHIEIVGKSADFSKIEDANTFLEHLKIEFENAQNAMEEFLKKL